MASLVAILTCVAIPIVCAYQKENRVTGPKRQPSPTAQDIHLRRRVQHALSGLGICLGYKWAITDALTVLVLLSISCAGFLVLHQLSRRLKAVDELYLRLMGPLLRPREFRGALPGAFWFLLGAAGAVAIFPRDVALQSILHLSVGDPVASVVGIKLGDRTRSRVLPSGKSLAGSFAAFVVCAMSTLLLFGCCCNLSDEDSGFQHGGDSGGSGRDSSDRSGGLIFGGFSACADMSGSDSRSRLVLQLWCALLGGVSGAVGELLPLGVDDNLSMPIVSGGMFLTLVAASGLQGAMLSSCMI